jgi:hypothetical protein
MPQCPHHHHHQQQQQHKYKHSSPAQVIICQEELAAGAPEQDPGCGH